MRVVMLGALIIREEEEAFRFRACLVPFWRPRRLGGRLYYLDLLTDLRLAPTSPTRIRSDSKSAIDLSYDPVSFKKTKHILHAAEGLRDYVIHAPCVRHGARCGR